MTMRLASSRISRRRLLLLTNARLRILKHRSRTGTGIRPPHEVTATVASSNDKEFISIQIRSVSSAAGAGGTGRDNRNHYNDDDGDDSQIHDKTELPNVDPPSKNAGTVVGAWIFCRHGDRTPSRPLSPPHRQADEAHYWLTKLPYPSTAFSYKTFSQCFPPLIDDPSGRFMDVHRNPYGFVTHKGLLQMQNNGRLLRQRYDPHSNRSTDTASSTTDSSDAFLKQWKVMAYSTNYLRTVMSVQSFLDGFLGTELYQPSHTRDEMDYTTMVRPQEWPIPDHNFIRTPHDDEAEYEAQGYGSDYEADPRNNVLRVMSSSGDSNRRKRPKVFVRVRDQSCDNLNAFDRNPDLMKELVSDVMGSTAFQQHDATAAPLAARLANILPGLARKGRSDFSAKTPSGINWVEAADHFVCRTSHQLDLSMFTDFEHDEQIEQLLKAMAYKALGHLSWRFRQWYQHPNLLAAIAAPPLREIAQQLQDLINHQNNKRMHHHHHHHQQQHSPLLPKENKKGSAGRRGNFVTVYSCHDVTLLALLYALGADFLAKEESSVWKEFWPEYASTLAIELVRLDEGDGDLGRNNRGNQDFDSDNSSAQHVIRVLMNGRVVISTDFMFQKFERDKDKISDEEKAASLFPPTEEAMPPPNKLGRAPYHLLTTQDFWNIVTQLESQGEYDFSLWPEMKDEDSPPQGDLLTGEPTTKSGSRNASTHPSKSSRRTTSSLDNSLN